MHSLKFGKRKVPSVVFGIHPSLNAARLPPIRPGDAKRRVVPRWREHFPVIREKFPVRARKIPCSVAQGICRQRVELPHGFAAKIVATGRHFSNSLIISLFSGKRARGAPALALAVTE
jgi:hypothetical protein